MYDKLHKLISNEKKKLLATLSWNNYKFVFVSMMPSLHCTFVFLFGNNNLWKVEQFVKS